MSSQTYHLSEEKVSSILDATNIEDDNLHTADPLTKSHLSIRLDQLMPYDNNPRTSRNPKFNEILISIENRGLDHPPNITRRSPHDSHYMIIDGGNTRLEILNILYEKYNSLASQAESEEERQAHRDKADSFFYISCVFKPWVSESKTFTGHMSENEHHGKMLFIEKALAVKKLRDIYENEDREAAVKNDVEYVPKPISMRKLAERITEDGWTLSASHITRYEYATNTLMKGITDAFWAGAGEPLVRSLRRYEQAYNRYWQESKPDQTDPTLLEKLFIEALRENDGEDFYMEGFVNCLNERLARMLDRDQNTVSIEIHAIMSGANKFSPSLDHNSSVEQSDSHRPSLRNQLHELSGTSASSTQPLDEVSSPGQDDTQQIGAQLSSKESSPKRSISSKSTLPAANAHSIPEWPHRDISRNDLVSMIIDRVQRIANRYGFEVRVSSPTDIENGSIPFFITPSKHEFMPGSDDDAAAAWWALTKYSGSASMDQQNNYTKFERSLQKQYRLYLDKAGPMGTLIHIEACILGKLNSSLSEELFEIQRLCTNYLHQALTIIRS
jgi:ParB family protein of integrating conjugative element (PFGI_1 class)